jgi:sodium/bile acid cotransporter 7
MLDRLTRVPVDTFLLALLAVVTLAALFPATGTAADVLDVATKVAIALLFLLYGVRLSPTEAPHGLKHWRLHVLVLPAAIVSASLSNILGVVLTPLLVVLLMHTTGAPRVGGSAVLDIVLQLLLPFVAGQLLRPWLAAWVHRHAFVTKAFDRGSILLVVYTAFSMSMAVNIWSSVSPWRVVAVAGVCTALLAIMLGFTIGVSRLARLNRADAAVALFCGSKKSLASGLPMALVFFGTGAVGLIMLPLMLFHQIQLFVCAIIASRISRTVPAD